MVTVRQEVFLIREML